MTWMVPDGHDNAAGRALRPELAVEIGQIFHRLTIDPNYYVAALYARLVGRPVWRDGDLATPHSIPQYIHGAVAHHRQQCIED